MMKRNDEIEFIHEKKPVWTPALFVRDIKEIIASIRNAIAGAGLAMATLEAKKNKTEISVQLVNKWTCRLNNAALLALFSYVFGVSVAIWAAWATENNFWSVMSSAEQVEISKRLENRVKDAGFSRISGVVYPVPEPVEYEKKTDVKKK